MAKILAPNKDYTGESATVAFAKGVGYTDNPHLIDWFKTSGYQVIEDDPPVQDETKPTIEDLRIRATELEIEFSDKTQAKTLVKKIAEAEEAVAAAKKE